MREQICTFSLLVAYWNGEGEGGICFLEEWLPDHNLRQGKGTRCEVSS